MSSSTLQDMLRHELYAETRLMKLETGRVHALVRQSSDFSERPRCVLIHGNPGSLLDWEQVIPLLSQRVDLAALDLPGFGRSPRPGPAAASLALERMAEAVAEFIDRLCWRDPVFLLGHSHGGGVAQLMAARYPDRIAGIVLVNTLGAPAHLGYRLLPLPGAEVGVRMIARALTVRALRPLNKRIARRIFAGIFAPEPAPAARLEREFEFFCQNPHVLSSMVHVALGEPCRELLQAADSIRCPALFIHGEADMLVPPNHARSIHERIRARGGKSEFRLVPGGGHMLPDTRPREIARAVAEFCERVEIDGAKPRVWS